MKYTEYLEKIKNFSEATIIIYNKYAKLLDYYNLDYEALLIYLPKYAINTKRLIIAAVISYYKFLNDERWKQLSLPKRQVIVKDYISYEEYRIILSSINRKTKTGQQLRLIVRLLFETGIRSQELLNIRVSDIYQNQITINGKGKKQRIVKVSNWLLEELQEYIRDKEVKLFNFCYKNLYSRIQRLGRNKKISPHMFRRGYAKYCFSKGISIYDISLSMGHTSIETTTEYIKRDSFDINIQNIFK